ncbi:hypothetical protein LTR28_002664 [Elasticomyces elasticus]|nr:hypothetical protein LTR28_002664 [Elasticomyces elasticus]
MASGTLFAQPLGPRTTFNWVFLVELLVCGILALFFLFYFNRLFATIIGYTVRAYTWHKFRAYIDITALQISLLGGRIFFKSIRYHGHNETILVRDGHITWRYWLARVEEAEIFKEDSRGQTSSSSEDTRGSNEKPTSRNRSIGREEKGSQVIPQMMTNPMRNASLVWRYVTQFADLASKSRPWQGTQAVTSIQKNCQSFYDGYLSTSNARKPLQFWAMNILERFLLQNSIMRVVL